MRAKKSEMLEAEAKFTALKAEKEKDIRSREIEGFI